MRRGSWVETVGWRVGLRKGLMNSRGDSSGPGIEGDGGYILKGGLRMRRGGV